MSSMEMSDVRSERNGSDAGNSDNERTAGPTPARRGVSLTGLGAVLRVGEMEIFRVLMECGKCKSPLKSAIDQFFKSNPEMKLCVEDQKRRQPPLLPDSDVADVCLIVDCLLNKGRVYEAHRICRHIQPSDLDLLDVKSLNLCSEFLLKSSLHEFAGWIILFAHEKFPDDDETTLSASCIKYFNEDFEDALALCERAKTTLNEREDLVHLRKLIELELIRNSDDSLESKLSGSEFSCKNIIKEHLERYPDLQATLHDQIKRMRQTLREYNLIDVLCLVARHHRCTCREKESDDIFEIVMDETDKPKHPCTGRILVRWLLTKNRRREAIRVCLDALKENRLAGFKDDESLQSLLTEIKEKKSLEAPTPGDEPIFSKKGQQSETRQRLKERIEKKQTAASAQVEIKCHEPKCAAPLQSIEDIVRNIGEETKNPKKKGSNRKKKNRPKSVANEQADRSGQGPADTEFFSSAERKDVDEDAVEASSSDEMTPNLKASTVENTTQPTRSDGNSKCKGELNTTLSRSDSASSPKNSRENEVASCGSMLPESGTAGFHKQFELVETIDQHQIKESLESILKGRGAYSVDADSSSGKAGDFFSKTDSVGKFGEIVQNQPEDPENQRTYSKSNGERDGQAKDPKPCDNGEGFTNGVISKQEGSRTEGSRQRKARERKEPRDQAIEGKSLDGTSDAKIGRKCQLKGEDRPIHDQRSLGEGCQMQDQGTAPLGEVSETMTNLQTEPALGSSIVASACEGGGTNTCIEPLEPLTNQREKYWRPIDVSMPDNGFNTSEELRCEGFEDSGAYTPSGWVPPGSGVLSDAGPYILPSCGKHSDVDGIWPNEEPSQMGSQMGLWGDRQRLWTADNWQTMSPNLLFQQPSSWVMPHTNIVPHAPRSLPWEMSLNFPSADQFLERNPPCTSAFAHQLMLHQQSASFSREVNSNPLNPSSLEFTAAMDCPQSHQKECAIISSDSSPTQFTAAREQDSYSQNLLPAPDQSRAPLPAFSHVLNSSLSKDPTICVPSASKIETGHGVAENEDPEDFDELILLLQGNKVSPAGIPSLGSKIGVKSGIGDGFIHDGLSMPNNTVDQFQIEADDKKAQQRRQAQEREQQEIMQAQLAAREADERERREQQKRELAQSERLARELHEKEIRELKEEMCRARSASAQQPWTPVNKTRVGGETEDLPIRRDRKWMEASIQELLGKLPKSKQPDKEAIDELQSLEPHYAVVIAERFVENVLRGETQGGGRTVQRPSNYLTSVIRNARGNKFQEYLPPPSLPPTQPPRSRSSIALPSQITPPLAASTRAAASTPAPPRAASADGTMQGSIIAGPSGGTGAGSKPILGSVERLTPATDSKCLLGAVDEDLKAMLCRFDLEELEPLIAAIRVTGVHGGSSGAARAVKCLRDLALVQDQDLERLRATPAQHRALSRAISLAASLALTLRMARRPPSHAAGVL